MNGELPVGVASRFTPSIIAFILTIWMLDLSAHFTPSSTDFEESEIMSIKLGAATNASQPKTKITRSSMAFAH